MSKENTVENTTKPMAYDALLGSVDYINGVKTKHSGVLVIVEIGSKFYCINDDADKLNDCTGEDLIEYGVLKICGFENWKLEIFL